MKLSSPVVSTQWLADHLDDPKLRIFDCSIYLTPNTDRPGYRAVSGQERWSKGHIPGAHFLDMRELHDTSTPGVFRTLPAAEIAERCGRLGIGDDTTVVLYSGQTLMWSTRMWWTLRSIGFDNAAILDGGLEKWERERPMSTEVRAYEPARLTPRPVRTMNVDKSEVVRVMRDPSVSVINALQPDVYDGRTNRYGRPGHIPGSHGVYYGSLVDAEDGTFLPMDELKSRFAAAAPFGRKAIVYCGGGVSATIDALALTMLGHEDVSIYEGSMMEWAKDAALPLVLGAEPG